MILIPLKARYIHNSLIFKVWKKQEVIAVVTGFVASFHHGAVQDIIAIEAAYMDVVAAKEMTTWMKSLMRLENFHRQIIITNN